MLFASTTIHLPYSLTSRAKACLSRTLPKGQAIQTHPIFRSQTRVDKGVCLWPPTLAPPPPPPPPPPSPRCASYRDRQRGRESAPYSVHNLTHSRTHAFLCGVHLTCLASCSLNLLSTDSLSVPFLFFHSSKLLLTHLLDPRYYIPPHLSTLCLLLPSSVSSPEYLPIIVSGATTSSYLYPSFAGAADHCCRCSLQWKNTPSPHTPQL